MDDHDLVSKTYGDLEIPITLRTPYFRSSPTPTRHFEKNIGLTQNQRSISRHIKKKVKTCTSTSAHHSHIYQLTRFKKTHHDIWVHGSELCFLKHNQTSTSQHFESFWLGQFAANAFISEGLLVQIFTRTRQDGPGGCWVFLVLNHRNGLIGWDAFVVRIETTKKRISWPQHEEKENTLIPEVVSCDTPLCNLARGNHPCIYDEFPIFFPGFLLKPRVAILIQLDISGHCWRAVPHWAEDSHG